MTRLEDRLKELGDGFPETSVHGSPALPRVVKRGRIRRAFTQGVAGVAASAMLVGGAVAAPRLLDNGPDTPVILGQVDDGPREERKPAVERSEDAARAEADAESRKAELVKRYLADEAALKRQHDRATDAKPVKVAPTAEEPTTGVAPETKPEPKPLPPEPKPDAKPEPVPPVADWRFSANQRASVVEGNPPVNAYWGTGKPGTQVKVWSDHGHVYTDVDREGHWETRLAFEGAPRGEKTFRVTVFHKATDHQKSFELTTVRPSDQPKDVAFTVDWVYESCDEDTPYQDASGTAQPNSEVLLWSEYGQTVVRANAEGRWEGRVLFHDAPRGERAVFDIKARSQATGEAIWFRGFVTERPA